MTEPVAKPDDVSDAAWMYDIAVRLRNANRDQDDAELARLVAYVQAEGNNALADIVRTVVDSAQLSRLTRAFGLPPVLVQQKPVAAEDRICDFCASPRVEFYYPFERFQFVNEGMPVDSGDRMYVCGRCHGLVEANDWKGLRDWVGPNAHFEVNRRLWMGFKLNRTGPALPFDPTDAR